MAFVAERHQVWPVVPAAVRQLDLVVNHLRWRKPAVLMAQLAERVLRKRQKCLKKPSSSANGMRGN